MLQLILICITTLFLSTAVFSQSADPDGFGSPVSRREVKRWLTYTQDDAELSAQANLDLISEIKKRGVDFAFSSEEEWAFKLLEASEDLLVAIREGMPEPARRAILEVKEKRELYTAFISTFSRVDLQSRKTAFDAGQQFVKRFASDPTVKEQVNFINRALPQLDRSIKMLERGNSFRPAFRRNNQ